MLPDFKVKCAPSGDRSQLKSEGSSGRSHSSPVANAVTGAEGAREVSVLMHDDSEVFVVAGSRCVIFSPRCRMASDQLRLGPRQENLGEVPCQRTVKDSHKCNSRPIKGRN